MIPRFLATASAAFLSAAIASAQTADAPPVNVGELLAALKQMRETQATQVKAAKQSAVQQVAGLASSGERAAAVWEDAVFATQFNGQAREGTAFREWKDKEGSGLSSKEAQNAARLFFQWMHLTLQRSAGVPVKDLLPQVINHTKELAMDQQAIEAVEESIKKDKELAASGKHGKRDKKSDDEAVKRMHDQILGRGLAGSPVAQYLKVSDWLAPEKWEGNPGNSDAIFNRIILPELRAQRDPRILEYWDMKLKREAEGATAKRLEFETTKFNTVRRPQILWSRADELTNLGQKNKAIGEMFALIKAYPTHPDSVNWMTRLEEVIAPPAPAPAAP